MKLTASEISAADDLIDHLCAQIVSMGTGNPLRDRYLGFCAVTAATHIETVVKEVTLDFCMRQNRYLHSVLQAELRRFNARVSYSNLFELLKRLDPAHSERFKRVLNRLNEKTLLNPAAGFDLLQSYQSLLDLRHSFVHNFNVSFSQVSVDELRRYISAAKRVACAYSRALNYPVQ